MKARAILALIFLAASTPTVAADAGMMGSGGFGMGGMLAMGIYGLIYLAIAALVFSLVFWWTYKWMVKEGRL